MLIISTAIYTFAVKVLIMHLVHKKAIFYFTIYLQIYICHIAIAQWYYRILCCFSCSALTTNPIAVYKQHGLLYHIDNVYYLWSNT